MIDCYRQLTHRRGAHRNFFYYYPFFSNRNFGQMLLIGEDIQQRVKIKNLVKMLSILYAGSQKEYLNQRKCTFRFIKIILLNSEEISIQKSKSDNGRESWKNIICPQNPFYCLESKEITEISH